MGENVMLRSVCSCIIAVSGSFITPVASFLTVRDAALAGLEGMVAAGLGVVDGADRLVRERKIY
jgi:hypothetical protein